MRVLSTIALIALARGVIAAPVESRQAALQSDALTAQGLANLQALFQQSLLANETVLQVGAGCTLENASVRKEWSSLTSAERLEYIAAVQCLSTLPPRTPAGIAAGVRNRYDDFVAAHIQQTLAIHLTGSFLTWHRYFVFAYEQVLRTECGFTGTQPYYNWALAAADPLSSLLFDGSAESMSGDGSFIANRSATCVPSADQCLIPIPPGNGGGCVTTGPFVNWTVNLGPVVPALLDVPANPDPLGLGFNPRCLRRDINPTAASFSSDAEITALLTNNVDFLSFANVMQGDFAAGNLGVHGGGHFTVGGDPGGDFFTSVGDPYFFLHHAMIDRTYWTWQNLDLATRQSALAGTITIGNVPASRDALLTDVISLGSVGVPDITIGDATSTIAGPFCYLYQ